MGHSANSSTAFVNSPCGVVNTVGPGIDMAGTVGTTITKGGNVKKQIISIFCGLALLFSSAVVFANENNGDDDNGNQNHTCQGGHNCNGDSTATADAKAKATAKVKVKVNIKNKNQQGQVQVQRQSTKNSNSAKQTVTIVNEDKREFLRAPSLLATPSVVVPFKQDSWINHPTYMPGVLTFEQANECRAASIDDEFDGTSRESTESIQLVYLTKTLPKAATASYVGTAWTEGESDTPFITSLCEAAYRAMEEGINLGFVSYAIKPLSKTSSFGLGSSVAGSITPPAALSSPYAVSGTMGPSIGKSKSWVEGELTIHITGFRR